MEGYLDWTELTGGDDWFFRFLASRASPAASPSSSLWRENITNRAVAKQWIPGSTMWNGPAAAARSNCGEGKSIAGQSMSSNCHILVNIRKRIF
jgi:hypothetical protein